MIAPVVKDGNKTTYASAVSFTLAAADREREVEKGREEREWDEAGHRQPRPGRTVALIEVGDARSRDTRRAALAVTEPIPDIFQRNRSDWRAGLFGLGKEGGKKNWKNPESAVERVSIKKYIINTGKD